MPITGPETLHPLYAAVLSLLQDTAQAVVMPRFQSLAAHEIAEKSPGEIVTVADREAEEMLSEGLLAILPEARIVGEESAEENPGLLEGLDKGMVWIVDPIDGTSNFSEGKAPFALMIALLADGETEAGWMFDPVTGRICHAHRRHGAFVEGDRIVSQATRSERPKTALGMQFMDEARRTEFAGRAEGKLDLVAIPRCAGEQYPRLVLGQHDIALFERILPWDHAPGALFVEEAGGKTARPDGSAYRPAERRPGLLSAATPQLWDQAAEILFD
ncbi:inositol monophosphatase family protein [Parasphingopyxis marina]|uniref:Inositol monophosphatase n=1 Tax=Parasphingopyxis marina TaxID=2761622 RepID=A0A842I1T0_9SPHN|nr:inositol monophosphatase family protein [Parasphingopyxis marina]MBC2777724.1 inositol monophosphatase [Parasphingopyxis marina]